MNEQQSQNLLLKVTPLSAIRNKLIMQGEKLETLANLRVFISPEYIVATFKAAIYGFLFSYSAAFRTQRRAYSCFCSAKFELRC